MNSGEVRKPIKPNKGPMVVTYKGLVRATPPRYMQVSMDKIEGLQKDVPNFIKNVPNFVQDVPRGSKFVLKWETTSNHFLRLSK